MGLGLQEVSPALSIGFRLTTDAQITDTRIALTSIRATRNSYAGGRATIMLSELALETRIRVGYELELDSELDMEVQGVDVPDLLARFRIVK